MVGKSSHKCKGCLYSHRNRTMRVRPKLWTFDRESWTIEFTVWKSIHLSDWLFSIHSKSQISRRADSLTIFIRTVHLMVACQPWNISLKAELWCFEMLQSVPSVDQCRCPIRIIALNLVQSVWGSRDLSTSSKVVFLWTTTHQLGLFDFTVSIAGANLSDRCTSTFPASWQATNSIWTSRKVGSTSFALCLPSSTLLYAIIRPSPTQSQSCSIWARNLEIRQSNSASLVQICRKSGRLCAQIIITCRTLSALQCSEGKWTACRNRAVIKHHNAQMVVEITIDVPFSTRTS